MYNQPFFHGGAVPPDLFIGRKHEIRHVIGRIIHRGQSTAIVGEPRSGKTSILDYLAAPQQREKLYGTLSERLHFVYLDAHKLGDNFTQAQFWEHMLRPVEQTLIKPSPKSSIAQTYIVCRKNAFSTSSLERLFEQLVSSEQRLVLLLDEFDVFLHHPILNCAEFFGSLRALTSRSRGALALVLAARDPLDTLSEYTQAFNRGGSPYFNFLSEITLGPFTEKDIATLLGGYFTPVDRRILVEMSDGHPFLLQVAASALVEAYRDFQENTERRWLKVCERLYDAASSTIGETWRSWSSPMKMAFTIAALPDVTLEKRRFYKRALYHDARDFGPEWRKLQKRGFVQPDTETPSGWRACPLVACWWIADEIVRNVRDETTYTDWLRQQEWPGLLTRKAEEQLKEALRETGGLLKGGAQVLINAASEGFAKGISGS